MSSDIKQVIVMRSSFPDGRGGVMSPRKGKLCAQAAHASIAFLTRRLVRPGFLRRVLYWLFRQPRFGVELKPVEREWLDGNFAKICVKCDSEDELLDIYNRACDAGLEAHLVRDSGLTEFHGPTKTCVAIGPDYSHRIDPITGGLKLL